MSKVLVICAKRYNGHELWTLLGVLQERKHTFEVVSQDLVIRDELTMRPNTIERKVWDVDPMEVERFDAITVVSGNMDDTEAYWKDSHVSLLLEAFRAKDRVVAAICCSVPTLAPVVKDIKVSFFPLVRSRHRLQNYGAILQKTSLTVDQRTVTAENQMLSQMWAEEICNMLEDKPPQYTFFESGFVPKGRPRRVHHSIQTAIDSAKR
jgi:putative intracellular protease/amidase